MIQTAEPDRDLTGAIGRGDAERVGAILTAAPARLRETPAAGVSLLTLAVRAGQAPVVHLLLEFGASPTWPERDAPGGRALFEAARAGRADLVTLLLQHGADPNVHVDASGNAVFAAARFPEIRALLEAHGGTLDPYDLVWLDEDDEVLRRIAADPGSAHAGCGGVYTAVVTRGKRELFMRLLAAGVHVPTRPCGCRSYLLENVEMLGLLLAHGRLDPDYPDDTGTTLLHALCRRGDAEMMTIRARCAELLLAAGANLDARDGDGATPLDLAQRFEALDLVRVLQRPPHR